MTTVSAVDYHTAGEPFRIVTTGAQKLEGRRILDKRRFAAERLDEIRRLLVHEPRGHEPTDELGTGFLLR
jgi:proline racemase